MDKTEDFLRLVLPAGGVKFIATPYASGHGFKHVGFNTCNNMAKYADECDHNVYFALAGFHEFYVEGADGKRSYRTHENVDVLRSLWVDLDVKEGQYATQLEAITDLIRFTKAAQLPTPTIVNSGGGIHAYWPLDADIKRSGWKVLATMFKAVTIAFGLKADPVRTADESSVLRVPGTVNAKPGVPVRPVSIVGPLTRPIPVVEFATALRRAFDSSGASMPRAAAKAPKIVGINSDLMMPTEPFVPANAERIIARCPQIAAIAASHGNVAEPVWYAALQLARHCADGAAVAHAWSDGHPTYDDAATDRKIEQLESKNVGPTSCAKFDSANPGVCASCPHYGKITSPIQLGRELLQPTEVDAPTLLLMGVEVELPPAPEPYFRKNGQVVMAQLDEDGAPLEPSLVYRYDLYPISRYFDEFERKFHTKFRTYQPKRGWFEFDVPNEVLYERRALAKCLANADVLPNGGAIDSLGDYIVSYTQRLQELTEASNLFMQMGWRDDETKFIIGRQLITADAIKEVATSTISTKAAEKFKTSGSPEEWRSVIDYYSERGNEGLLFGFLTAFGAPLFKLTGFNGAIINMMGPSGTGKSTVLKAMNTVYGQQDCAYFQLMDTEKSFYRRVGVLNNLPIAFDEITNIDSKRLSDLCYDFTQGRERMRLTASATERRDTFSWQTIMLSSANASLHGRLASAKGDASAESVRVFEYNVSVRSGDTQSALELKKMFDKLGGNYGHVGAAYMQHVLRNMDTVRAKIATLTDTIYETAKLPSSERFWAAIIASNLTGGAIAKTLGLVSFDEARMMQWAMACIQEMRGVVQEYRRTSSEILADWLAKMVPNTLVVQGRPDKPGVPAYAILPRGEMRVRYDKVAGIIYIPRSVVQALCAESVIDMAAMKRDLTGAGILIRTERKVLGAGTDFQTGQTSCWVLNTRTPLMEEITGSVDAEVADHKVVPFNTRGHQK